jgi:hypothetical protein
MAAVGNSSGELTREGEAVGRGGKWVRRGLDHVRALAVPLAAGCALYGLYPYEATPGPDVRSWQLLGVALAIAVIGQMAVPVRGTAVLSGGHPIGRLRRVVGIVVFAGAAVLWGNATHWLYLNWGGNFDSAWLGWLAATVLMSVGLDVAWRRWSPEWIPRRPLRLALMIAALFAVGGVYRFGNLWEFPGPYGITQIEDLQFGNWGAEFLAGNRSRWEFIGHAWLSALGIWLFGASLGAIRMIYALVSNLTVIAVFVWLRFSVGTVGALFGAGLLAVSSWDIVQSRIPFNPNILVVSAAFALVAGPARRGRPSAYVCLGMMCGYILWEYIAYRPLAVFAVFGVLIFSLRDRSVGWLARIFRPTLTVAMIATLVLPLFLNRLHGRVSDQYLNGLNRARAVEGYYDTDRSWQKTLEQRLKRAKQTTALLFYYGDSSPARNFKGRPLVDPISAVAMLIGFGFALSHWRRELFGLFAVAFLLTTAGAMIVTGDFNALRMTVTIPYLYFFAGCAGASLASSWQRAWGRPGVLLAIAVLAAAVAVAAYSNTRFLRDYWQSDFVKRAQRSNRVLLADWLRENAAPGEQVVGGAPRFADTLTGSDAAWLRGPPLKGSLSDDIQTSLREWKEPGPTVLLAFSWKATRGVQRYLEFLIPDLQMTFVEDPLDARGELAFAHLPTVPAGLSQRLEETRCRGARGVYEVVRHEGDPVRITQMVPYVDDSTWPSSFERTFFEAGPAKEIRMRYSSQIRVIEGGAYRFKAHIYPGKLELEIDDRTADHLTNQAVLLEPGLHRLEAKGVFKAMSKGLELNLFWEGPDTGGQPELMPFYRIAVEDPACLASRDSGDMNH